MTVFIGDSVSVAEAAGTGTLLANYTSSLACDNGITLDPNNGTSGSFNVPTVARDQHDDHLHLQQHAQAGDVHAQQGLGRRQRR